MTGSRNPEAEGSVVGDGGSWRINVSVAGASGIR
jgi:hypothetical protein